MKDNFLDCDGKTLWTKVEKKTELEPPKKTIFLAMFTCQIADSKVWADTSVHETIEDFKSTFDNKVFINHHEIPNTRYEQEIDE